MRKGSCLEMCPKKVLFAEFCWFCETSEKFEARMKLFTNADMYYNTSKKKKKKKKLAWRVKNTLPYR